MTAPLRLIFMGTPDFAVPSLQALLEGPDQVVAVVCQPDRQRGRGKILSPPPVKALAQQHGIPVLQPVKVRHPDVIEEIRALKPDLIVVIAFGQILPKALLEIPGKGCINVHASLLPRYRGAAPLNWCIINGETEEKTFYDIVSKGSARDMRTFDQHLLEMFETGLITEESAMLYASHRSEIKRGLDTIKSSRGERTSSIDDLRMEQEENDPYNRWS